SKLSQDPTRWTVTAGGIKQNTFEYSKRMYQIESIMMYKDYDEFSVENDIALVMLKSEIKFSNYIRPICLPSENDTLEVGTPCYLAGYGDTHGNNNNVVSYTIEQSARKQAVQSVFSQKISSTAIIFLAIVELWLF
ncbi:hypothetical protein LOTGIDRAFT_135463, partial [Lottia gigantea]